MVQPEADAQIEVETGTADTEKFDAEMAALGDDWQEGPIMGASRDTDEKYQFMMDTLSEGPSLQEQLMEQLIMVNMNPQEQAIAELLIGNIDDEGYLQLALEEMMDRPDFPIDLFEHVLSVVQSFEPAGIGARDLKSVFCCS